MPFFERPLIVGGSAATQGQPASLLIYPAAKVPFLLELGILVKEGVKRGATTIGILANEKVTRRDSGCGPFTPTGTLLKMVKNQITVDPVEIKLEECASDYTESVLEATLKAGHAEDNNLEGTGIEAIVRKALNGEQLDAADAAALDLAIEPVIGGEVSGVTYKDALRIWMLGDRASDDVNYNQTDGIRKKLLAKGIAGTVYKGMAIPSLAAMKADPTLVLAVLEDLYENCADELQEQDDDQKAFYVDSIFYRFVRKAYRALVAGNATDETKLSIIAGSNGQRLTYEGIELIEFKPWYKWMKADFAAQSPFVAIYTVRENLVFATDLESDMAEVKFWYDINTEFNRTRVKYRLGAGFGFDVLTAFSI
ncbi:hypothetical protein [Hymenobacter cellulosivorans]|uniref:Phage major capsid protein n=1 Tax=Hymenobacter cellulosivorans TaxID=2932249 RepID=A0ABY4F9E5_9BACT|nr:hypothetical protein [Hymenobacter cellulosivorans]UOQ53045.1 hypothetical protein MUN80_25325 [Hymenobacter cellulosivorans]